MDYFPIRIGTLRSGEPTQFDVFVQVADHHIHYFKAADAVDANRILSLKTKGVKKLFIQPQDEDTYLKYLDAGLERLKDKSITLTERGAAARDTVLTSAENAAKNVQTAKGYAITESHVQKVVGFLTSESNGFASMFKSSECASDVFEHATNVVTLSLKLAIQCGITAPQDLLKLAMAGLLHDLGKTQNADPADETIDPQHPMNAVAKLQDKPYVNAGILSLIMDHEEFGEGGGYPGKKRLSTLPKLQQILNLCNDFDRTCSQKQIAPADAMKLYYVDKIGAFDLQLLGKLAEVLKLK